MSQLRPFAWNKKFISISPFSRGKNATEAMEFAKDTLAKYNKGQGIGFTFESSLKSMGKIKRASGRYTLGAKYKVLA